MERCAVTRLRVRACPAVCSSHELLGGPCQAFLRVGRTGLQTVALGDSDRCALGDWAVALGHPAEFDRLATFGIVSTILRPTPTGPGISPHAMLDRRATFIATGRHLANMR
jgi:S1-C subfamily serine protease